MCVFSLFVFCVVVCFLFLVVGVRFVSVSCVVFAERASFDAPSATETQRRVLLETAMLRPHIADTDLDVQGKGTVSVSKEGGVVVTGKDTGMWVEVRVKVKQFSVDRKRTAEAKLGCGAGERDD